MGFDLLISAKASGDLSPSLLKNALVLIRMNKIRPKVLPFQFFCSNQHLFPFCKQHPQSTSTFSKNWNRMSNRKTGLLKFAF